MIYEEPARPSCSIVVCTRNRADSLRQTLDAALDQSYPPDRLELLVIDNGSTDHTAAVVDSFGERAPFAVRRVEEDRIGLSHARNRGVAEASGSIVLFLDDDAWPVKPTWVQRLASAYSDPQVAAAGGDLLPIWPASGPPTWLTEPLLPSLGLTAFHLSEVTETHYPTYPWGANLSYRRERVEALGGFSPRLGRSGDQMFSGEETEMCLRLERAGSKVLYVPDAAVHHDMTGKQLTMEAIVRYAPFQGISDARIDAANLSGGQQALAALRRVALYTLGTVGGAVFSERRAPQLWVLAEFKRRAAQTYLRSRFSPRERALERSTTPS